MLKADEDLLRLVMENSPSLIFVKDENSVILHANRAFLEFYPPERRALIIGHTTAEDFSPEEAETFLEEDRRALARGVSEMVEEIVDYRGMRRVLLSRKVAFVTSTGMRRLLCICNDITELAERERGLVELNRRLESFCASAAHDLRSPLASFVSAINIIKRDRNSVLSPSVHQLLDLVGESADSLADNVSSMLVMAKNTAGKSDLAFAERDLNLLLAEARFNLSDLIARTGAHITAMRLPRLRVEGNLVRQLIQNLIENSIKHRGETSPRIVIRYAQHAGRHLFSVTDNGRGMSSRAAARAFELYEQERAAGVNGVGIGLALCKQIVTSHVGRIWVDTSRRKGCRIWIELPLEGERGFVAVSA